MPISVVLVDDHGVIVEGLQMMLREYDDIDVVGEADGGKAAVALVDGSSTDVVVMDVSMSDMDGIEATQRIKQANGDIAVVAFSMHMDRRIVTGMLKAGANGFVHKSARTADLVEAIRTVAKGRMYLCPKSSEVLALDYVGGGHDSGQGEKKHFTNREIEIIRLLAEGYTTKRLAEELGISANTADTHRSRILSKLGTRSIAVLTRYAIREGLISVD